MSFTKLNRLAQEHAAERDNETFRSLYDEAKAVFQKINRTKVTRSGYGDNDDADEIFDAVVWKLSKQSGIKDFGRMLSTSLKNARLDFFRSEASRRKGIDYAYEDREESTPILEFPSNETPETDFFKRKKETDQRQLVDFFRWSAKTDATMTQIIEAYEAAPPDAKRSEIARSLGMHHEYVDRKLRRIARQYDAVRFGDFREYLAV